MEILELGNSFVIALVSLLLNQDRVADGLEVQLSSSVSDSSKIFFPVIFTRMGTTVWYKLYCTSDGALDNTLKLMGQSRSYKSPIEISTPAMHSLVNSGLHAILIRCRLM